jgi:hypothetical protein
MTPLPKNLRYLKPMNLSQRLIIPACFFAAVLLSGCTRGAQLNIVNSSTAELTNVVATGDGFTQTIGSIPAGEQHSVSVRPPGESDLKLDFDANGKHFTSAPQGYFENSSSYKVTATISPDFTVTVDTPL